MIALETIINSSREELENLRLEIMREQNQTSSYIPFYVLAALKTCQDTVSNSMFYILLHYIREREVNPSFLTHSMDWLDSPNVKRWLSISHEGARYVFFLNEEQSTLLQEILESSTDLEASRIAYNALPTSPSTEAEKSNPIAQLYQIPLNSGSINIEERTSRFSGATWYEGIKQKTIILAGLGGIGSYVCFLLARMQPTSLFIYDDDIVEAANMSGQLYGSSNVGEYKVDAISSMVSNYAGYDSIFAIREKFTSDSPTTDIMICGFDNMVARTVFFHRWCQHVAGKSLEDRGKCLFIDGRLSAEYLQVFSFTGDDCEAIERYRTNALFSDSDADETVCSYKQTSYMANMIGSLIVNIFTNFVANEVAGAPIRELPYFTEYDGNSMQLKIE